MKKKFHKKINRAKILESPLREMSPAVKTPNLTFSKAWSAQRSALNSI